MKEIQLTQGKVALVDDEDFEELSKFKWYISSNGYAKRDSQNKGIKKRFRMHLFKRILNT